MTEEKKAPEIWAKVKGFCSHFIQSISTKVLLLMLLLILPFNFLAIWLSERTMSTLIEQARVSVQNSMNTYLTNLDYKMETTVKLLYNLRYNDIYGLTVIKQAGDEKYAGEKVKFYYSQKNYYDTTNVTDAWFIYLKKLDDVITWDGAFHSRKDDEVYIREQEEGEVAGGWTLATIKDREAARLFIDSGTVTYGGWIYLDTLLDDLKKDLDYESIELSFSDAEKKEAAKDELVVSSYCKRGRFFLNAVLSQNEVTGKIEAVYGIMHAFSIVAFLLIPILYALIQRLLLHPLRVLNQAQKRLRNGDLDCRITEKANSIEYEHSFQSFNKMADRIQDLKIEVYEKELDRKQMELSNLQLQIRPHFRLKTFNLMYTLAQRGQEKDVQQVILYLSDYFRYLFRSGRNLEIFEKEQHLIEAYIGTAKVRYPGAIEADYEYDPEIAFVRVPPLLLHNFVENIVKYAISPGKVTHISIVGQYEGGMVSFMIMDDGGGMTEEQVEELDRSMREPRKDGLHIGYANSLKRLRYSYGEKADIEISSEPGEGVCVTVTFPYDLEEENEPFDSE